MPFPLAVPLIAAGATLASSAFNAFQQTQANDTALKLSRTSHQREVNDLKAAGLNPILSAGGKGAPMAPIGAPQIDAGQAVNSAVSARAADATLANVNANTEKALAEAQSAKAAASVDTQTVQDMVNQRQMQAAAMLQGVTKGDVETSGQVLAAYRQSLLDNYSSAHSAAQAAKLDLVKKQVLSTPWQLGQGLINSAKSGLEDWRLKFDNRPKNMSRDDYYNYMYGK